MTKDNKENLEERIVSSEKTMYNLMNHNGIHHVLKNQIAIMKILLEEK